MSTTRSDQVYLAFKQSAERFDYFVTGVGAALCAYVGQDLEIASFGLNATTLEAASLTLFAGSTVLGLKRIEANVEASRMAAGRLYHGEAAGAKLDASRDPNAINVSTGELKIADDLVVESRRHRDAAAARQEAEEDWTSRSKTLYVWRNRTLIGGFVLLALSRVLPALIALR